MPNLSDNPVVLLVTVVVVCVWLAALIIHDWFRPQKRR